MHSHQRSNPTSSSCWSSGRSRRNSWSMGATRHVSRPTCLQVTAMACCWAAGSASAVTAIVTAIVTAAPGAVPARVPGVVPGNHHVYLSRGCAAAPWATPGRLLAVFCYVMLLTWLDQGAFSSNWVKVGGWLLSVEPLLVCI